MLREERNPFGKGGDLASKLLRRVVVGVKEAQSLPGRTIEGLGGQQVLHCARLADHGSKERLTPRSGCEADGVFKRARERVGARKAHIHLDAEFLSETNGAAVDLGDEGGAGGVQDVTRTIDDLVEDVGFGGCEGQLDVVQVVVAEEPVGVSAVEDDDFRGGFIWGGLQRVQEVEEVGYDECVDEVNGWVVEGGPCNAAIAAALEGDFAVTRYRGGVYGQRSLLGCACS